MDTTSLYYPQFSVLLSVYSESESSYFDEALKSIWDDQSLRPSQIVLVKDGPLPSTTLQVIEHWKEKLEDTLFILDLVSNVGLAKALNEGLNHCKHDLVARMDTDDISMPNRFELQVEFLCNHPEISVLGGTVEEWSDDLNHLFSVRVLPSSHTNITKFAKYRNPLSHPSVMYRKSHIQRVGGYPSIYPEDYPLWGLLIAKGFFLANIPNVLVKMRIDKSIAVRRGLVFLPGQIKTFMLFLKIGFFTKRQFVLSSIALSIVRLSPGRLRRFMYEYLRS